MKWSTLECASGPATEIPRLIEQLGNASELKRRQAFTLLRGQLASGGQWFTASAPSIPLLAEVAKRQGSDRHRALWLMAEIFLGGPYEPLQPLPSGAEPSSLQAHIYQTGLGVFADVATLVGDREPLVAAAACEILGILSNGETQLLEMLDGETHEIPRASALIALALQRDTSTACERCVKKHLSQERPLVKTAAALAALRLGAQLDEDQLTELVNGLSVDACPWEFAGRSLPTLAATLLSPVAAGVRARLAEKLARHLVDSSPRTVAQQCEWPRVTLSLVGLPVDFSYDPRGYTQSPTMLLASDLSDVQRQLLLALNVEGLRFAGTDVPWDALTRRRWLGEDEPTALEKHVAPEPEGATKPAWFVWQRLRGAAATSPHNMPMALRELLAPAERVQALLLASTDAYGLRHPWSDEERRLVFEWATQSPAESEAVARRFLADNPPQTSERAVAVKLLVRANEAMKPEWDTCALTLVKNLKRIDLELLQAIPVERREAIALQGALDLTGIEQSPQVVRLVPTIAVVQRYLSAIGRFAPTATGETLRIINTARDAMASLAGEYPELKAAVTS